MLQAAACHEMSIAQPLSVFDKRQPEHKKEGESEEEKDKVDAQQAGFQRRQVLKAGSRVVDSLLQKPSYFKSRAY